MNRKYRGRSAQSRSLVASAQDLQHALQRSRAAKQTQAALATCGQDNLPPQAPPFLGEMPPLGEVYQPQQQATKELKLIIEELYYGTFFKQAIAKVSAERIPELDQIHSLDQFYFYVDALVTWIPEIRVWDFDGDILHERTVYLRITQFYYYFNQPQLEALQSPIKPVGDGAELSPIKPLDELSPISNWLRNFAVQWGSFLDTPASAAYLETFKYAPEYAWQDYEMPPEDYPNFNTYFARKFRDIKVQRPLAAPDDPKVIVFPAESTFVGQWAVSTPVGQPLVAPPNIVVKNIEWSITELLADSVYAEDFQGGIFCHSFLNTYDYHRMHTSVAGKVLEARFIPGQVYLEVNLEEDPVEEGNNEPARAVIPNRLLDADDNTGYQFVQCRGLIVLESAIGKVAILPMGMAQVSSVVFVTPEADGQRPIVLTEAEKGSSDYWEQVKSLNQKVERELVGKHYNKGEMFSYFQFGGSDCVMVFERKACVNISAQVNVHYPIRSQYATANM